MATTVTFALVYANGTRLRYLATASAIGDGILPNTATAVGVASGATPDLAVDAITGGPGKVWSCAFARFGGIGNLPPGALTQAQARACLNSDGLTAIGTANAPRAICRVNSRTLGAAWDCDVDVDGGGDPVVHLTASAAGTAYLDIEAEPVVGG